MLPVISLTKASTEHETPPRRNPAHRERIRDRSSHRQAEPEHRPACLRRATGQAASDAARTGACSQHPRAQHRKRHPQAALGARGDGRMRGSDMAVLARSRCTATDRSAWRQEADGSGGRRVSQLVQAKWDRKLVNWALWKAGGSAKGGGAPRDWWNAPPRPPQPLVGEALDTDDLIVAMSVGD